jgi:DNA-damage-inducible protein J
MKKEIITVRVDSQTKSEVESLFSDLGMNISVAINIFLKQCIAEGKIPFEIARKASVGRKIKPLRKEN